MANPAAQDDIWADDRLGRKADAEFLVKFLLGRSEERSERGLPRSYVLNLDAQWGRGKTFFLLRLGKQLERLGHPLCYVNAWKDDHADDPLLPVMSAIDETLVPHIRRNKKLQTILGAVHRNAGKITLALGKGVVKTAVRRLIGDDIFDLDLRISGSLEDTDAGAGVNGGSQRDSVLNTALQNELDKEIDRLGNALIDEFRESRKSIEDFRNSLQNILIGVGKKKHVNLPMFILIDELDRCRPSYAIALLERVKHLFEVNNTIFIVATDSEQLQHSIKVLYGAEFESDRYLKRFFDRSFCFREPSLADFVAYIFETMPLEGRKISNPPNVLPAELFSICCEARGIGLRDVEQCFDLLRGLVTIWNQKVPLELLYLVPLLISFHVGDKNALFELTDFGKSMRFNFYGNSKRGNELDNLLQLLVGVLDQPLSGVRDSKRLRDSHWLRRCFESEVQVRFGSALFLDGDPKSFMHGYIGLVRDMTVFTER